MEKPILKVFENVDELLNSLVVFLIKVANEAIEEKGEFTFALSGGNSPKRLYELLASEAYNHEIDWNKIHFFFGDERYVPSDSPDSNALMVKNALFDPLAIPKSNIHAINMSLSPEEAAHAYYEELRSHFRDKPIQFDFILLGLGDNVHTASLFPYTDVLLDTQPSVRAVFVKELDAYRITLNAPLINQANHVVFLVYGENKAEAVGNALGKEHDIEKYPAQLIHPDHGSVYWFLDEEAAALNHTTH